MSIVAPGASAVVACGDDSSSTNTKPGTRLQSMQKQLTGATYKLSSAINVDAKYYVDGLAKTLKAELSIISSSIKVLSSNPNNSLNLTPYINKAISNAKANLGSPTINPGPLNNIALNFSTTNKLAITKNNVNDFILTVHPFSVTDSIKTQSITTNLSLTLSPNDKYGSSIVNDYRYNHKFVNYTTANGLGSNDVNDVASVNNGQHNICWDQKWT